MVYKEKVAQCWVWKHTSILPVSRRLRQEECEFEGSPGYTARLCLREGEVEGEESGREEKKEKVAYFQESTVIF